MGFFIFWRILTAQSDWGEIKWDNGIKIENPDEGYKIKFGGRIMLDALSDWPEHNGVIDTLINEGSGVEFRRLRLFIAGQIYHKILFKLDFDFAGGTAQLRDAYITVTKIPLLGNLQFGHFKEPIGLELLSSSNFISMMERGLTNPLTPDRNTGVMAYNNLVNERLSWAFGYFLPSDNFGKYAGGKFNISGRLSGLPVYHTENRYHLLHLGLSLTHQYQDNSKYTLSSRPESNLIATIAVAEIDYAKAVNQFGLEGAWVFGPLSVQGEYIQANAWASYKSTLEQSNYNFKAYYGYFTWFISGEHRMYNPSISTFDRIKPKKNFGKEGGPGAWEVAMRYSEIDLDDTDIRGGTINNLTTGINWYLNPATRIMFNYILSNLKGSGKVNIFQMRIQLDF
jgi:phosphate-selective porin OprO/OprP